MRLDMNVKRNTCELVKITSEIVIAQLGNRSVESAELHDLIESIYRTLRGLEDPPVGGPELEPAVCIAKSIQSDHLVCLEDGKKMKLLKRHLMVEHGMTPDEYRRRWELGANYPMICPDYAATRSRLAKDGGLGVGRERAPKQVEETQPMSKNQNAFAEHLI